MRLTRVGWHAQVSNEVALRAPVIRVCVFQWPTAANVYGVRVCVRADFYAA